MQHFPGAAWIKDERGSYLVVNDRCMEVFGRPREEILGRTDEDLLPVATAARFRSTDRRALDTPGGIQEVEALEHPDGVQYSLVSKFAIPGPDGGPRLVGGVAIDITRSGLVAAEEERRASEARFRELADHAPVMVWVNGLHGCEFVNREYLRFIGVSLDEVIGMNWAAMVHPDDRDDYLAQYQRAFAGREQFEALCRFRRRDGQYRWIRSTGVPRVGADGHFSGYVGSSVDITDIKQAHEALLEADRRKDEFLATLAHELRNPLAPLSNGLQLMKMSADRASVEQAREMMSRQLGQMVRMVDDLLDVSRISRGQIELRHDRVRLADVLENARETAQPLIERSGHSLSMSLPAEPLYLQGDRARLSQVFSNLLNNAANYTPPRGSIALTAERQGGTLTVSVKDNGIGIPHAMLPRIFDLFTQVDRSLERTFGGLGIGLTIVRRLVEMHGGTIEARSEGRGKGSEFIVRLPAALWIPEDDAIPDQDGPGASRGRTVLVVDDNRDAATTLGMVLEVMGHQVRIAHDGIEALEAAEAYRPDVILLDLGMPRLNGYEVCRTIREKPWGRDAVVVALTGWGQPEDQRRSKEAGFNHHLVKPVQPAVLERIIVGARIDSA
jgi:PAS domain S-box-containing protein